MRILLVPCVVSLILSTTQCSWLEEMERICGPVVDDLFYTDTDLAGKEEKCRLMRAAFKCIEDETNQSDPENWKFMVATHQVQNISIGIANRCQKESLMLCPRYKMNRRLQQCYNRTGVHDMDWTCYTIHKYASQLNKTLDCMENEIKRCPNDDFIKDDLSSLGNWTQTTMECLHLFPTTTIHPNKSEHGSVSLILSTTRCSWLEEMKKICGPVVDDLFYTDTDLAGKEEKCRLMRAAFKCIEDETNLSNPEDWKFMVATHQVQNISIRIANRCQKESLILCPRYKMNRRLQQCYNRTGVQDMDWTCYTIHKYASRLNKTLDCMENEIKRCPNDDFIKDDLSSLGNWTQTTMECLHLFSTTTIHPNKSEHGSGFGTTIQHEVSVLSKILLFLFATFVK